MEKSGGNVVQFSDYEPKASAVELPCDCEPALIIMLPDPRSETMKVELEKRIRRDAD